MQKPIKIIIENPEDWDYAMARGAEAYAKILVKQYSKEEIEYLIEKLKEMSEEEKADK